jgi:hypothetical protein
MTLYGLVAIHLALPFTWANTHPEQRIIWASLLLGTVFLTLALWSLQNPCVAFACSLALLLAVYGVSHLGGASPITEGWPIKLLFAGGLSLGLWSTYHQDNNR